MKSLKERMADPATLEAFARYGSLDPRVIELMEAAQPWRRMNLGDLLDAREYHERELAALEPGCPESIHRYHDCGVGEIERELQRRAAQPNPRHPAPRRLSQEFIDRLKADCPTHEYAHHVGVKNLIRSGTRYKGLCPAHPERTPSFTIFEDGPWYCFGCTAAGDVIELARTLVLGGGSATFLQAVKVLSEYAHIPMPEMEPLAPRVIMP